MGFSFRKRIKLNKNSWINLSKQGASGSVKVGPVTFNTRGGFWVRLPGGFNYRGKWKK